MSEFVNIPAGLKIPAQIPLDVKTFCANEATLSDLGTSNNLAYTYYDSLRVHCIEEKSNFIWREVQSGEENTGLISTDFTYPDNIVVFGITYSNKVYNFFEETLITSDNFSDYVTAGPPGLDGDNGVDGLNGDDGIDGTNGLNADMTRTSTSSNALSSSGTKTFIFSSSLNLGWTTGTRLRFINDLDHYMEGVISTPPSSTSVTVNIDYSVGTGTFTSWNIVVAGNPGVSPNYQKTIIVSSDYTLSSDDDNYTILIDNKSNDVTITVPSGLTDLFSCILIQEGTGLITLNENSTTIDYLPGTGLNFIDQNAWAILQKVSGEQRFKAAGQLKI